MPETTFTESYLETIDELLAFADKVSEVLNITLIKALGESADWGEFVGLDFIPNNYLYKFEVEDRDYGKNLWALREQAHSILNWEADHSLSDWVKDLSKGCKPDPELEMQNLFLNAQIKQLEANHAKALKQAKESHTNTFTCFKADVIVLLNALELVAIASKRHGDISLNHFVRDMRLAHLQSIITNAIKDFSDRTLSTYDDDF